MLPGFEEDYTPPALLHIINAFLLLRNRKEPETQGDVTRLVTKEICPKEELLHINVRRDYVVLDAIREGKKKNFY